MKTFEQFKSRYEEIDVTTLNEIFEEKGGINNIDVRDVLNFLNNKYMGKKIRVYFGNHQHTINVRRIDAVITINQIRQGFLWLFYFAENPNNINDFKVAPGPEDKIAILKDNKPINLEADPYGEEEWDND